MNEDMDPVSQLSQQLSTSYPSVALKRDEKVSNTFDSMIVLFNSNDSNDDYLEEINSKNIENLNVMQLSPIEFNFINTKELLEALINVDFWSALCITSKRCIDAIEYTINTMTDNTIDNNIIDLWKNQNKTIFVVGDKSKDYLLKRLNWESIGSHCGSAQMLAQFIIDNYKHQFINKHILFPCSSLRNDSLPLILKNASINVNEIIVYETIPNRNLDSNIVKLNSYIIDCLENSVLKFLKLYLVFFSPSGLNSVYPLLLKHILSNDQIINKLELKYIAFGAMTASALQQSGLSVWFTCPKPNPKSLAQALYQNLNIDPKVKSASRLRLESWLNKNMKILMSDGRTLVGIFLCTDRDRNVILGSCLEYLKPNDDGTKEEPRVLGLAMIPGPHIVSIHVDETHLSQEINQK